MLYGAQRAPAAVWADRDVFDLFDSDRDGLLSADEILLGLGLMAQPVTRSDVEFLIGLTDGDGDGRISRAEFAQLRERAPAPFYGGELVFAGFGSPVIDTGALLDYLRRRGLDFSRAQVTAFLRNVHPQGRAALPCEVYEAFVRAYREA
ncbi:EF-hand domain-containing protein [Nonomuraea sp. NPDC050790]|uniref:EF-hand domain-containing protein n=1 Tax=Nonomuraea sp. NPDC050790 TaxID=3364371 RepID=UPI0037B8D151